MHPREVEAARALWPLVRDCATAEGVPAVTLLAVLSRESACGLALDADGCGDRCLRCASRYPSRQGLALVDELVDGWAVPRDDRGEVLTGPYIMPADGLGWGRGLAQLDYASHREWVQTHDWRDPATNIRRGARVLREAHDWMHLRGLTGAQLWAATIAAYNGGTGRVLAAVQAGHDPDDMTSGRDYSAWVQDRARLLSQLGFT